MAITQGAGPHFAWLNVNGGQFQLETGSVEQHATRRSSTFSAAIPMSAPGATSLMTMPASVATITCETRDVFGTLITGEVDRVDCEFMTRTIRVMGRDLSAKLHENVSNDKWNNQKQSAVVQDLCNRCGLTAQIDTSTMLAGKQLTSDYVKLSDNVTFAQLIHKMAELDGARWWVDQNGTFHYSLNPPGGVYTLNYQQPSPFIRSDCLTLRIDHNLQAGKTIQVNLNSWHPYDRKVYSKEATSQGNGGPLVYSYDIPGMKQDHVDKWAKERANEEARHELNLHATVAGDPTCNPWMMLQLNGTGVFDQQYEMDTVVHTLGNRGHLTNITARSGMGGRSAS